MSENFIIENTGFEQDLSAEISDDSFEARKKRNSSRKGTAKAITNARRSVKKAQSRVKKAKTRLRSVTRKFRQDDDQGEDW